MRKNLFNSLQIITRLTLGGILLVFFAGVFTMKAYSKEAPPVKATTTGNPDIPVAELEWRLKPLTVDELEVEANGWLGLLKQKVEQIARQNIALLEQKENQKERAGETGKILTTEEPTAKEKEEKTSRLDQLTQLREERTALLDRLRLVVDAYEEKGGDESKVTTYRKYIETVNLLSTHLMTFDNKAVIIPNNAVWGGVITHMTATGQRRADMVFGIGYDDDIDKAQRILEDIVHSHKLVLKDPEPVIRMNELGESSVNFIVRPWAKTEDLWTVYWDITREVKKRFDKEGISIPFPQRDVHVYNASLLAPITAG
jgi:hypothetical protein